MARNSPWTLDVNWMYIRPPKDFLDVFWMFFVRSSCVLCPGVADGSDIVPFLFGKFPINVSIKMGLGNIVVFFCYFEQVFIYFVQKRIWNPISAGIYLLKVINRNTRTRWQICSKLTIKTPERRHWRPSGVFMLTLNIFHTLF